MSRHLLRDGSPLCDFTKKPIEDWGINDDWVKEVDYLSIGVFGRRPDCSGCLRVLARERYDMDAKEALPYVENCIKPNKAEEPHLIWALGHKREAFDLWAQRALANGVNPYEEIGRILVENPHLICTMSQSKYK